MLELTRKKKTEYELNCRENERGRQTDREISRGSEGESLPVIWVCIYVSLSNSTCQMGSTCSSLPGPQNLPFFPPRNFQQSKVFFHFALGDDSLGLLRFTLSRIRAGRLLIIFDRLRLLEGAVELKTNYPLSAFRVPLLRVGDGPGRSWQRGEREGGEGKGCSGASLCECEGLNVWRWRGC